MPDKAGSVHKKGNDTGPFTFLFLSNMIETKGVYVLLEACALLKQKGYAFHCNFVGQWFDVTKDSFNSKSVQLGVTDCVQAHGPKYGAEKDRFLQQADGFVFPTFYPAECLPLVLIEAMQYALPVISTNEAAIPDIIEEGENGWIIEKQDVHALAEKMEWMIKHPNECQQMGVQGCLKYEREYTLQRFEHRLTNIFLQLTK
jgi:glycosyltransferase involved in cell wall biosynthesis